MTSICSRLIYQIPSLCLLSICLSFLRICTQFDKDIAQVKCWSDLGLFFQCLVHCIFSSTDCMLYICHMVWSSFRSNVSHIPHPYRHTMWRLLGVHWRKKCNILSSLSHHHEMFIFSHQATLVTPWVGSNDGPLIASFIWNRSMVLLFRLPGIMYEGEGLQLTLTVPW